MQAQITTHANVAQGPEAVESRVLTAQETFKIFRVSENAGYQAVQAGTFPVKPILVGRRKYVFSRAEVERVLSGGAE